MSEKANFGPELKLNVHDLYFYCVFAQTGRQGLEVETTQKCKFGVVVVKLQKKAGFDEFAIFVKFELFLLSFSNKIALIMNQSC